METKENYITGFKTIIRSYQVTIVLPTMNEEDATQKVIEEVKQAGFNNILVVDGYSTDETVNIAKRNDVRVIQQTGQGKSGAIATALKNVRTPYMLLMDCDSTYDPLDIPLLLNHAEHFDMLIGARRNGRQHIPSINRLGNWIINKSFNILMGTDLSDVCSGMYLLKTDAVKNLDLTASGFSVEVDIVAQLAVDGRVGEVPISYRERVGKQKLSKSDGFKILYSVVNLARKHNPILLFSVISALIIVPASILLLWVLYELFINHNWHSGYALFGVMLFLVTAQGITVATISALLKRIERRITNKLKLVQ